MSVKECQEKVDSKEFAEWQVFHKSEPFGEDRTNYLLGYLIFFLYNSFKPKGQPKMKFHEVIPESAQYKLINRMKTSEMKNLFRSLAKIGKGTFTEGK